MLSAGGGRDGQHWVVASLLCVGVLLLLLLLLLDAAVVRSYATPRHATPRYAALDPAEVEGAACLPACLAVCGDPATLPLLQVVYLTRSFIIQ